ncbi:mannan endo-1,4-beta-mannosidase [Synchytrium microbalum]|uniref:Mannan endo-1,4-beta-mannosidase n=1 Tax=Synchytrium microbalum TaxID=1806994 RepID=A0A507BW12_9FUNG|nr:mannan endo-1,4-beta-mannosidase [Synchytrium microbalum]TPX31662.1 mannan endo-1,4-beta-mannosidase [Synchytrium microbalum]
MGTAIRKEVLALFFWLKVWVSICILVGCFAFMSFSVWRFHENEVLGLNNPIVIIPGSASCAFGRSGYARLEPPVQRVMYGFSLDWKNDTPTALTTRLNKLPPAVVNAWISFDNNGFNGQSASDLNWFGYETFLLGVGTILEITMVPLVDMSTITTATFTNIAQICASINSKYAVPILLRLGHEMNGNWEPYGQRPTEYVAGYKSMATILRKYTNLTAMVWAPNIGTYYPYASPTAYQQIPPVGTADFKAMDTNSDGVIDEADDPYGPYYPGDDYVDWVGISLYWYPTTFSTVPTPATYVHDAMLGTGPAINTVVDANYNLALHNFYNRFALQKNKPFCFPESGAPVIRNGTAAGAAELNVKQAWWQQTLSASNFATFPKLKLVVNFEESKIQDTYVQDWSQTLNPTVRVAFVNDISTTYRSALIMGSQMTFNCDGSVTMV